MNGLSIDALILGASAKIESGVRKDDTHLNSVLAGTAYDIGFKITEEDAGRSLEALKKVLKRKGPC